MSDTSVAAMRRVHIVTFARDGATRTVSLRRSLVLAGAALKLALIVWAGFSLYLLLFRDTLVDNLLADQAQMRVEYEEKLAAQRVKLDEAATRQATAQDSFEGRLRELLTRQAQLETRTETVAQLLRGGNDQNGVRARPASAASGASGNPPANATQDRQSVSVAKTQAPDPLKAIANFAGQRPRPVDDGGSAAFYADDPAHGSAEPLPLPSAASPQAVPTQRLPRFMGPRSSLLDDQAHEPTLALAGSISIESVVNSLDTVERLQVETLEHANSRAAVALDEMRGALRRSGLDPARFARAPKKPTTDTGGPFMPLPKDAPSSSFDALLHGLKVHLEEHDQLSHTISLLPVRQPLPGQLEITSPYGARRDPFGMGWALHAGVDLRAEEGSIVRATAAGKIVNAAYTGGYGNMVEIEHSQGVSTRYGHLSAILVSDGQNVSAGTPIGRVGSTGRSTGPHLHYETRIDNDPVDPMRFLKSADMLLVATGGVD
ncbi:Murein DD-endopeptidase MepM and murein hydrolase activator NlpD, contain LysM domain [Rhizobiales bacterium GAS191]|nr:Murein DD-endopeptidase MepM and murein hydrolase activator NlpD, contain LysM domain [Rhizobiales bacterium GAS191]